ncbi:MAG TPA: hypothetical protein VIV60_19755, partial [Polyangiaceae bacterium]
ANELCDLSLKRKKDVAFVAAAAALAREILGYIREIADWLGLFGVDANTYRIRAKARRVRCRGLSLETIEAKLNERWTARANKEFARSDAIRDELLLMGVSVKDTPDGQLWTVDV